MFNGLKEVAKGNEHAERFLCVFVAHCHLLDDIIDRDVEVTDERLMRSEVNLLLELTGNPFVLAHRAMLVPLIVQAYNAWLDANRMEKSDDQDTARAADVVKGFYHEVVWHVAFLCGGWEHLREMTQAHRRYDFDYRKEGA